MSEISFSSQRSTSTGLPGSVTIGGLARAAGAGVETVRYYQRAIISAAACCRFHREQGVYVDTRRA